MCVDESFSRWYGLGGSWISTGLPHYVSLNRETEAGCEIQDVTCGRNGVMLQLELVKSKEETSERLYESLMQHGPATVRRLTAPWANYNRIICADSYFASVSAVQELLKVGLKFIGVVKGATKKFPMKVLSNFQLSGRFAHRTMVSYNDNQDISMAAIVWADRDRRYVISTASSTIPSTSSERTRWREHSDGSVTRINIPIVQPKIIELYYSTASRIDRHNRSRQNDLSIERKIKTRSWSFRVNSSLLAMIVVDSWMVYNGAKGKRPHLNQKDFYVKLATELIDGVSEEQVTYHRNGSDGANIFLRKSSKRRKVGTNSPSINQAAQFPCAVYRMKTTQYCSLCGEVRYGYV